jgi:hypothetical protein
MKGESKSEAAKGEATKGEATNDDYQATQG